MESVVDEALRDIVDCHSGFFGDRTQIENAFVSNESVATGIENGVGALETTCDVIRVQNRNVCGSLKTFGAHHRDVGPRNGEDIRRSVRCR